MIFLKLHTLEVNGESEPFTINMSRVENFSSDGAGHTKFWYSEEEFQRAKESYEDVNRMLHASLIGHRGVISLRDVDAVVY